MSNWIDEIDMLEVVRFLFPHASIQEVKNYRGGEYKISCPNCRLCSEPPRNFKYLGFNIYRKTFKCYRGQVCGGVIDLVQEVRGLDRKESIKLINQISGLDTRTYNQNKPKLFHPAMKISYEDLKKMGVINKKSWYASYKENPQRTKAELDWIWNEYKNYKYKTTSIVLKCYLETGNRAILEEFCKMGAELKQLKAI